MHDGNLVVKNLDCDEHRKNKRRELDGSVSASCRLMRLGCMTWRGCTNALVGAQYPLHVVVKQPPPPPVLLAAAIAGDDKEEEPATSSLFRATTTVSTSSSSSS